MLRGLKGTTCDAVRPKPGSADNCDRAQHSLAYLGPHSPGSLALTAHVRSSATMTELSPPLQSYLGLGSLIDIDSEEWLADDSDTEEVRRQTTSFLY